ncbi:hypothetical protein T10_11895 [Trichinella papuae]|uniref:Uncharacterized protein n=1 Tax=Trichinella papuae TaxID=268474 RepID=A0A0V1MAZ9_9BILA|nr:hypothetical protein T10_11895 [Trichinella papuae]
MQMTPYKNPWTARGRSKENKRHVRFLVPTDSIIEPDPPSTDRSLRSAEDVASSPDGSFAP